MNELKPCPFCGSANVAISPYNGAKTAMCMDCLCMTAAYRGEGAKAKVTAAWNRRAAPENKALTLPDVSEQDRQSMRDFLHDCFAEWIDDPAVELHGMDEGEAELANAIMDALAARKPEQENGHA